MIDLRYVKKLIEMLDGSTVDSIEISTDKGMKIRLSKTPTSRQAVTMAAPVAMPVVAESPRATPAGGMMAIAEPAPAPSPPAAPPPAAAPVAKLAEIKSPMVGTFYGSPEPTAKAYISIGDRVKKGQVVCIIEAMKIMNEIEAEVDGIVREVLATNSHPVEYGQVLFRVEANG